MEKFETGKTYKELATMGNYEWPAKCVKRTKSFVTLETVSGIVRKKISTMSGIETVYTNGSIIEAK